MRMSGTFPSAGQIQTSTWVFPCFSQTASKQLSTFKLLFLFAACLLGLSLGREEGEGSNGARSQGLGVQVVGLEEGGLLQGVGISILQS